ncbi:MAG: hypothetical protein IJS09_02385 [Treponema sp.]|nr:hypothetical protein [Treponema sp.]
MDYEYLQPFLPKEPTLGKLKKSAGKQPISKRLDRRLALSSFLRCEVIFAFRCATAQKLETPLAVFRSDGAYRATAAWSAWKSPAGTDRQTSRAWTPHSAAAR